MDYIGPTEQIRGGFLDRDMAEMDRVRCQARFGGADFPLDPVNMFVAWAVIVCVRS
jgi:hypothetical protein